MARTAVMLMVGFCVLGQIGAHDTPFKEMYLDQIVDHFNFYTKPLGKDTFKHRYLVQDKWWSRGSGPIFFYTGNEGNIEDFWDNTGFVFDIAPKFGAYVVFAEHRFYGKSVPFGNSSFEHPYVDLLTMEQALADFAYLIVELKKGINAEHVPVIAFGGSYGGMLTTYLRMKYPNVVDGGLAASAPILLVSQDVSRDFFFQDVTKDFRDAVDGCEPRFRSAFSHMAQVAAQGSEGLSSISTAFHLCHALQTQDDFQHLLGWIRNSLTILAMFDYPYPTRFETELPGFPVKASCDALMGESDLLKGLFEAAALYYGNETCHDIYAEFVSCSDPTGCGTGVTGYAWDYQACTEFLMPAGTDNKTDMFPVMPFSLDQRAEYCQKRWGIKPRLDWVKVNLWGKDLSHTSNLIFSNGNLDPWHRGGVLSNVSDTIVALLIEGGAHHLDLRASNDLDPASVRTVRQKEIALIQKWVQEANHRHAKRV